MPEPAMLKVAGLAGWYGESQVLHGVDFEVKAGEVVTLLGRNGAGKSTTLKAVMGLLPARTGSIQVAGRETVDLSPRQIARIGLGYCPEERGIFSSLTVEENLMLPPVLRDGGFSRAAVLEMFPNLANRLGTQGTKLSGGEQQMLAIGRILRTGARLLLLDEPTEGLAPVIVEQIGHTIQRLRRDGYTIVLVEQNYRFAASVADRHYVMENGRIVTAIPNEEMADRMDEVRAYLSI